MMNMPPKPKAMAAAAKPDGPAAGIGGAGFDSPLVLIVDASWFVQPDVITVPG